MPYKVVSTIEKGKAVLTSVPSYWEKDGILFWPIKGPEKIRKNEYSRPDSNWNTLNCIVKRMNIATFNEAEKEICRMCNVSDTETDNENMVPKVSKRKVKKTFNDIAQECILNDDILSTIENHPTEETAVIEHENLLEENSYVVTNDMLSVTEDAVFVVQQSLPENSLHNINVEEHVDGQGQLDITEIFNILLTKIDAVNENLQTIGTNILENVKTLQQNQTIFSENQQKIMLSLSKLGIQFEQMIKRYSRPLETKETFESIQPISSLEDLVKIETSLNDPDTAAELKKRFSVVCGKGKGRGINNAYLLVDAMFDRHFLNQCSWAGGSRSSDEKNCFRSHTAIINFFFKLVHESDNSFTLADCQNFFKSILKNSLQRSVSKKMRTSAMKNRPKLKRIITVNPDDKDDNETSCRTEQEQSTGDKFPQLHQELPCYMTDATSSQNNREQIPLTIFKPLETSV